MARIDQYEESRIKNFEYFKNNKIVYPYSFDRNYNSKQIHLEFEKLNPEEYSDKIAKVAGRLLLIRNLGKIVFMDLHDQEGKIQVVVKQSDFPEDKFEIINKLDTGDIVGVTGKIFKTKRGEVSIDAQDITFLSKSFKPLPNKWKGLQDEEIKYRKRYLDLMINRESKDTFILRSKIISLIRKYLDSKNFMEVETPLLQPLYGGANARPFVTESYVWKRKLYLSISPELYLKRLLVGGYERVFTICKNFRNEGVDKSHNPEFTMIEIYEAYKDYNEAMKTLEGMIEFVVKSLFNTTVIEYEGKKFDFKSPWPKMTMKEALKHYANVDVDALNDDALMKLLKENHIELEQYKRGLAIAELFEHYCEHKLTGPVHIIDHPKETTPLCKLHRADESLIERDEPYLNGMELANIYSELNDPQLQEKLMVDQKDQGRAKGENHPIDYDFIEALKYGMPPAYGIGMGIDRLVIILSNSKNIRDVILFPLLKEEDKKEESTEN